MAGPICPWCGDEADERPEEMPFTDDAFVSDCAGCDRPIIIRRVEIIEYTAEKREES